MAEFENDVSLESVHDSVAPNRSTIYMASIYKSLLLLSGVSILLWFVFASVHADLVQSRAIKAFLRDRSPICHSSPLEFIANGVKYGMTIEEVRKLGTAQWGVLPRRFMRDDGVMVIIVEREYHERLYLLPFITLRENMVYEVTIVQFENDKACSLDYRLSAMNRSQDCTVDLKAMTMSSEIELPVGALCEQD